MMEKLIARAEGVVRAAQAARIRAIAAKLETEAGVRVETTADAVIVAGKKIVRRWLTDPTLRFLGSFLR